VGSVAVPRKKACCDGVISVTHKFSVPFKLVKTLVLFDLYSSKHKKDLLIDNEEIGLAKRNLYRLLFFLGLSSLLA
jgi:hypothetical protein